MITLAYIIFALLVWFFWRPLLVMLVGTGAIFGSLLALFTWISRLCHRNR